MSDLLSLERKLKEATIHRLTFNEQIKDEPYLSKPGKVFTRQDIANEIEAETEVGMEILADMLALALALMVRSKCD